LQDKHNIRTLFINITFIYTRCETGKQSSPKICFSNFSYKQMLDFPTMHIYCKKYIYCLHNIATFII
jgi:hypothetical protein